MALEIEIQEKTHGCFYVTIWNSSPCKLQSGPAIDDTSDHVFIDHLSIFIDLL